MALFSVQDNLVASSCVPFIQVSNLALECSAFAQSEILCGLHLWSDLPPSCLLHFRLHQHVQLLHKVTTHTHAHTQPTPPPFLSLFLFTEARLFVASIASSFHCSTLPKRLPLETSGALTTVHHYIFFLKHTKITLPLYPLLLRFLILTL